jgi:hypothetical protein
MSFCNFESVEDYCEQTKDYNYYYNNIIESAGKLVAQKAANAPVLRVNLFTDERKVLTAEDNESALVPCYQGDTGNILSDWECYSIWRQRNHTLEPLPEVWSEAQRVYIEKDYQKKIDKGYSIDINQHSVVLPRDKDSQLQILATLVNAIISNTDPVIQDIDGNRISIPQQVLKSNIDAYVESNRQLDAAKEVSTSKIDENATNIDLTTLEIDIIVPLTNCGPGYTSDGGECVPV